MAYRIGVIVGLLLLFASQAHAISYPAKTDMAVEWRYSTISATTAGKGCLVRIPSFESLRMMIPSDLIAGVYDEKLRAAPWKISLNPDNPGERVLWFEADGKSRYFLFWKNEEAAKAVPRKKKSKANKSNTPKPVNKASLSARNVLVAGAPLTNGIPVGLDSQKPCVEGFPAAVYGKNSDEEVCGGFLQINNTGSNPLKFQMEVKFHRDPWHTRQNFTIGPSQAGLWFYLPTIKNISPITLSLKATAGSGAVDFTTGLSTGSVIRSLPFTADGLIVEMARSAFIQKEEIKTDAEVSGETLAAVKNMRFKGKCPECFPVGYPAGHEYDYQAGRIMGFNAVSWTPQNADPEQFKRLGYRYIYSYTHQLTATGKGHGYDTTNNHQEMARAAAQWKEKGLLDNVYRISVFDEPGTDVAKFLETTHMMQNDPNAWGLMIRYAGLKPEDFIDPTNPPPKGMTAEQPDYWKYLKLRTLAERKTDPRGVLNTMLVCAAIYPSRFGNMREAIRAELGTNVLVTANVHDQHFMSKAPTDIEPWQIYSQQQNLDVPQACDYSVRFPLAMEFMIDLMRSSLQSLDKPIDAYLASQSHYLARPAVSLKLRAISAIGAGARSLSFYQYGPRYLATENWYDDDRDKLQAIGDIAHAVGWAEDILLQARPRPAAIAILWSRNGDLWDALDVGPFYSTERRIFHMLLRNLHLRADFINDQYMPSAEKLASYKIIFMSQRCLSASTAKALLNWVKEGGTLIASLSCGQLDELAQSTPTMLRAFGLKELEVASDNMRKTKDRVEIASRTINGKIQTAGVTAKATSLKADIAATFEDKSPAVLATAYGKGQLIYTAFLVGHSYHVSAKMENHVLVGMQESLRAMVAEWLKGKVDQPDCSTDDPAVSARLLEGPAGCAVVLVNSTGRERIDKVTVSIKNVKISTAESLEQGTLSIQRHGDDIQFILPLGLTDIVLLK